MPSHIATQFKTLYCFCISTNGVIIVTLQVQADDREHANRLEHITVAKTRREDAGGAAS
jgi:hypothetical protein